MKFRQWDVTVRLMTYDNGRIAVLLLDAADGSRVAVTSVSMPDDPLGPNEFYVKDWSENEGMLQFLESNGIAEQTGELVSAVYVTAKRMRLLGEWASRRDD